MKKTPTSRDLQAHLEAGGRFPEWSADDLREVIPSEGIRQSVVAGLRPRLLAFFTEPLPGFSDAPKAPCAYLQFSAGYDVPASQARQNGWPHRYMDAGHFHMLVDPASVADAAISLVREAAAHRL